MNKENTTRVTLDELRRMKGQTDYARLDAMTDEDIARAVENDPNMAPIGSIDWDKASLVIPPTAKDVITLRVDHDVLEWLRSTGPGYQTRVNQVLRAWYEAAHKPEKTATAAKKPKVAAAADVVESLKASGAGFGARVGAAEERAAKRAAARRKAKKAAAKHAPAKKRA
jgi:uncharacterized protein (DUF4415 family)